MPRRSVASQYGPADLLGGLWIAAKPRCAKGLKQAAQQSNSCAFFRAEKISNWWQAECLKASRVELRYARPRQGAAENGLWHPYAPASTRVSPGPSCLIRANAIRDRLLADRSLTLEEIAKEEKMVASYTTRLFRLTLLAPNIVGAILNGNQPPELTARKLMDDTRLPLDWNEQRRALGFA